MPRYYYESTPTACARPAGHTGGSRLGLIVIDGVPHCIIDAVKDFPGIVPWSTWWTSTEDSRTGVAIRGVTVPDDPATWNGPVEPATLKRNDFAPGTVYDVALAVQTVTGDDWFVQLRVDPDEMRDTASRSRVAAQLAEGGAILGDAVAAAQFWWKEA